MFVDISVHRDMLDRALLFPAGHVGQCVNRAEGGGEDLLPVVPLDRVAEQHEPGRGGPAGGLHLVRHAKVQVGALRPGGKGEEASQVAGEGKVEKCRAGGEAVHVKKSEKLATHSGRGHRRAQAETENVAAERVGRQS